MKLVVLDANAYWTEQLFARCPFADQVLLMKPREMRAHWQTHGQLWGDGRPRPDGDGIYEQRFSLPPGWMFYGWPLTRKWLARSVREFVGAEPYVLVLCFPQYRSILSELAPDLTVYYNYDDYRDNWPEYADWLATAERKMVRAADCTICIARRRTQVLGEAVPSRATDIHHVPIGCTPEFIAESPEAARSSSPPSALQDLLSGDGIIAGYVGTLGYRFDHAYLADVAERRRDVTFVLGGTEPDASDASSDWWPGYRRLKQQPNAHFIGWVPHDELGSYLTSFDVLLMLYAPCRFNRNACPAKLWDYLGTSRPIVANDVVPEVALWDDLVYVRDTATEFVRALDEAMTENNALPVRRLQIARRHTYSELGRRTAALLEDDYTARAS